MRSGVSSLLEVPFQVWNSRVFICAADNRPRAVSIWSSGLWSRSSSGSSSLTPGNSVCCACFWKKSSPPTPSGARTSDTGRPLRCGSIKGATSA